MGFKEVNVNAQYRKLGLWSKGDTYTGKFLSIKEGEYKGQTTYQAIMETIQEPNFVDYKDNAIEVGGRFAFPLTKATVDYFTPDTIGNAFQVTYEGKVANKAGDNSYHTFKILMDDNSSDTAQSEDDENFDL